MSVLRPFRATDIFKFNNINLDVWTETYGISFYLQYLTRWPDLCCVQEAPSGRLMGYVLGKAEGTGTEWHGHVTALSVAPEYRRLSLGRKMMALLEFVSDETYKGFFVDLYVRCMNKVAIGMYEGLGYSVYRRVREYYGNLGLGPGGRDEEDAFDMRKPLSRDPQRRSVRANGRDVVVSAHDGSVL
ncbi:acyl-CoA N-acyltransferase [Heliocybe sulcata]|uniref:Acyl-CoA N-acyltransferase n=1 Tax=Heliocybe sulcata TaxID=5364 RepID=A0A5C3NA30_9AGAM|nr:acyl-CoA N-acyltransferase [Heliocybe sulcata]